MKQKIELLNKPPLLQVPLDASRCEADSIRYIKRNFFLSIQLAMDLIYWSHTVGGDGIGKGVIVNLASCELLFLECINSGASFN